MSWLVEATGDEGMAAIEVVASQSKEGEGAIGVRDEGFQAGVDEKCSGIGVAPPEDASSGFDCPSASPFARRVENGTESNNFFLVLKLVISVQHHLKVLYSRFYQDVIIINGDCPIWSNIIVTSRYDHNLQSTVCGLAIKNSLNGAVFPFIRSFRDDNRSAYELTDFGNLDLKAGGLRCMLEIRGSHLHPISENGAIL